MFYVQTLICRPNKLIKFFGINKAFKEALAFFESMDKVYDYHCYYELNKIKDLKNKIGGNNVSPIKKNCKPLRKDK